MAGVVLTTQKVSRSMGLHRPAVVRIEWTRRREI